MTSKHVLKIGALGLIAATMTLAPFHASAADTNKPAIEAPSAPRPRALPFRGKLAAVDKVKMTITVGERTFDITSETKISRDGKPAILADAAVGDTVGGAYRQGEAGKLTATTVNLTTAKPAAPAN